MSEWDPPRAPASDEADEGPEGPEGTSRGATEHYFTPRPSSPHATRTLRFLYRGRVLTFTTDRGIFSYEGLDPGTGLLIENLELRDGEAVLDMGCGWGAIGIAAASAVPTGHVTLIDVNHRAVLLARRNARSNKLENVEVRQGDLFNPVGAARFDVIASNPAYKAGRPHVLRFLDEVPAHLREGGRLVVVGKGSQGILFYQRHLEARWGSVEVLGRGSGYRVLLAKSPRPTSG
jgi:16S rRNA (guanine1207-N2)-methyltransferase